MATPVTRSNRKERSARLYTTLKFKVLTVYVTEQQARGHNPNDRAAYLFRRDAQRGRKKSELPLGRISQADSDQADVARFCGELNDKPKGSRQICKALRWGFTKTYRIAELAITKGMATKADGGWIAGTAKPSPPTTANGATANGAATQATIPTKQPKAPTRLLTTGTDRAVIQIDGTWYPSLGTWDRGKPPTFWARKDCPCGGRLVVSAGADAWHCRTCERVGMVGAFDGYQ